MTKIDELSTVLNTEIINRETIAGFDRVWQSYFTRPAPFGWCNGTLTPVPGGMTYRSWTGETQMIKTTEDMTILLRFSDVKSLFDRAYKTLFVWKKILVLLDAVRAESDTPITKDCQPCVDALYIALSAINTRAQ